MAGKNVRRSEPKGLWGLAEVRDLLDLLKERGISEFEMEKDGFRVHIKQGSVTESAPFPAGGAAEITAPVEVRPVASAAEPVPAEGQNDLCVIKSPIVGTFYGSPRPEAPPFVNVGDFVKKGQVLCIIEAMKLMNEIEAEMSGEIAKIFVENGQPVEYGQSLFGLVASESD